MSIAAFSDALPDVLEIDGPYVGPWAAEGTLRPIDEYVSRASRADMLDSLIEQGTYENKLYALGAFDSALVVYYNRDMIEKAGLTPPERVQEAWTWDEFTAALRKVKPYAATPLSLHMDDRSDEWFTYAFAPLVWSNGGRLIDVEQRRAAGVLNGREAVEAIRRWQQLFSDGLAQPTSTTPNPFGEKLAAFDWTGHWMLPSYEKASGLRFGVMPLPKMDTFVAPSGSWCWGISRQSRQPERAWSVIEWLLDPRHGIRPIVEANGAVPGRRSAFELFPEYDEMPRRLFREQLEHAAHPRPRTPVYLTLTGEFARALRDIALGAEVEATLTRAAAAVQQAVDRNRDGG